MAGIKRKASQMLPHSLTPTLAETVAKRLTSSCATEREGQLGAHSNTSVPRETHLLPPS